MRTSASRQQGYTIIYEQDEPSKNELIDTLKGAYIRKQPQ